MKFKLIMVFVDQDRMEDVLNAARDVGATGATVIHNAQGQGLRRHLTFFGLEFMGARSVVLILAEESRSTAILNSVTQAGRLDESLETGIALELDVSRTRGLSEHIRELEKSPTNP